MRTRGAQSYDSQRTISSEGTNLVLKGKANYSPEALSLQVDLTGNASFPDDLACHSVYILNVQPQADNSLRAVGQGSLFRKSGEEIKLSIEAKQSITPSPLPDPIDKAEFRIATESGHLRGLSYTLTIHSIFDASNSMAHVAAL